MYRVNTCTGLTFSSFRLMGSKPVRVVFWHVTVWVSLVSKLTVPRFFTLFQTKFWLVAVRCIHK